ncbi:uncharacterized protein LOC130673873 isoform X1 [Microplitis mediator]|uniref:uncharacterized protein LOC130673873 isoform X1 n=1 Tax=Microplitis mediator TaxID=375433 RepID=UPI0025540524|nr:uncharacterized protein LOC130673873 isoform X1 [Microplitis mediator]
MFELNNNLKIFIVLLICKTVNCFIDPTLETKKNRDHYIDPHSIYYNKYTQQLEVSSHLKKPTDVITTEQSFDAFNVNVNRNNDIPDELFSRRFVNLLLEATSFEKNGNLLTSSLTVELTTTDLIKLKNFAIGKSTIREIDSIIGHIFIKPEKIYAQNTYLSIKEFIYFLIIHKEITLITIVVLWISWIILTTKWNMLKITLIILLTVFAASFIITWLQLLREAEIKLTVKQVQFTQVPIQCNPHKMSWWDKLWTAWSSVDECQKYYEAMMENPFLQVTPAQALSKMIATCVVTPVGLIGHAVGDFVNNATKNLWFPIQMVVAPLLIIGIILITGMVLVVLGGGSLNLWGFGPFSVFSLCGRTESRNSNLPSTESQNVNLPSTERQAIQPIYNFNLHGGQIHEIAIKNTSEENLTSVNFKADKSVSLERSIQALKNDGHDVEINLIKQSTLDNSNLKVEESKQALEINKVCESIDSSPVKCKNEENNLKLNSDENRDCICKKKVDKPISESGDN